MNVVPLHARRFSGHSATLPDDGILRDESAFEGSCLDGTCMCTFPNGKVQSRESLDHPSLITISHPPITRPSVRRGSPCDVGYRP